MNTHDTYVSLETAKMLKEAGFDWEVNTCRYNSSPDKVSSNGTLTSNFNGYAFQHIAISAPTLAVTQRWLREVKNIHIEVSPDSTMSAYIYNILLSGDKFWLGSPISYDTYEEAQEAGIQKCLTILIEEKK